MGRPWKQGEMVPGTVQLPGGDSPQRNVGAPYDSMLLPLLSRLSPAKSDTVGVWLSNVSNWWPPGHSATYRGPKNHGTGGKKEGRKSMRRPAKSRRARKRPLWELRKNR